MSAALALELVTTFHAARPPLMWSIEPKMRATLNGSEKLVETVAPRPICVVQAAERGDQRGRLEAAHERRMVARVHHHRVGDEQQVELAALGDAGDLLHHRQFACGWSTAPS